MKKYHVIFLVFVFGVSLFQELKAQNYIQINDHLGYKIKQEEKDSLEFFSTKIKDVFDLYLETENSIKVYDVSLYAHSNKLTESIIDIKEKTKQEILSNQAISLIFFRVLDDKGEFQNLNFELVFDASDYSCFDIERINHIYTTLAPVLLNDYGVNQLFQVEKILLSYFSNECFDLFCCSEYYSNLKDDEEVENRSTSSCINYANVDAAEMFLLGDSTFHKILTQLYLIKEQIDSCSGKWTSQGKDGIIPKCFWLNSDPPVFGAPDIAVSCGIIDGAASELIGLIKFIDQADSIAYKAEDIITQYLLHSVFCNSNLNLTPREFNAVLDNLYSSDNWLTTQLENAFEWFYNKVLKYIPNEAVLSHFTDKDCSDLEKTANTVDETFYFITNIDSISSVTTTIINRCDTIINNFDPQYAIDRYYLGYYGFKFGVVAITMVKSLGQVLVNLSKMTGKLIGPKLKNWGVKILDELSNIVYSRISKKPWFSTINKNKFHSDFFNGSKKNYVALRYFEKNGARAVNAWDIARRANLDDAIKLNPDDLSKIDDYVVRTGKSADDVVEEIVGNSKAASSTSRSWVDVVSKGAGAKVGQLGNYSVHEGGEVIYRTISQSHYDDLLASSKLKGTGETTTAGVIGEAQGYSGITVKFYVKDGTINEFVANGRMAQSSHTLVTQQFGITQVAPSGWNTQFVRFKQENGLVNIQLGKGPGLDILNNNLIGFEKISVQ